MTAADLAGEATLRFEGVELAIRGNPVLRGVDLALAPGEVLALAGRNGAGKTTLCRVAAGLLAPRAGRACLFGRDVRNIPRRELARELAVVPQDAQFAFPFRVLEIVLMGRAPHLGGLGFESRRDVEIAHAALAEVGIGSLAERSVLELSGGERQLVLVARALAQAPRVLLLDEPTAHLDLRHRIEVLERVRAFAAGGGSALVVSHDLTLAARACDRIALLAEGRVLACGTPAEVLRTEHLSAAFGIEARVETAADGAPLVVPRIV